MSSGTPSSEAQSPRVAKVDGMVTCKCGREYNRKVLNACPACSSTSSRGTSGTAPIPPSMRANDQEVGRLLLRLLAEQEKATRYTRMIAWGFAGLMMLIGLNFIAARLLQ